LSKRVHLVLGPTAAGKSQRAIEIAQAENGVILNADATQCYRDLHILSARPDSAELAQAEHQLYGVWPGSKAANVADWLQAVIVHIQRCWQQDRLPILCGGTGMYVQALQRGLSPIPPIPEAITERLQAVAAKEGNAALHQILQANDPQAAQKIPAQNTQRLVRALAVYEATGTPISQWQAQQTTPPLPEAVFSTEVVTLPREQLYQRINQRFDAMLIRGAVAEVEALLSKQYAADLPIMKAVGVPEISAYLQGECSLNEATEHAKQQSRRYAKRQLTWLRHQL